MIPGVLALLAVLFILCAALLTAAEAAFFHLPRHDAEQMLAERPRPRLRRILADPTAHTHAVRFWRIWFETASAVAIAILYHDLFGSVWIAGLLATATMAAIGFVLVGVSPRRFGRIHAAAVVAFTAPLVRLLRIVLGPIPGWLVAVGNAVDPNAPDTEEAFFTEEHLRDMVDRANEADVLEDAEADLIHSVFELSDTRVRSVMVPRTDMVTVEYGTSLEAAMSLFLRSGCSRIPVIRDSADQVTGIVYLKDVAARLHAHPDEHRTVESVSREVRYVPESKLVGDLLRELQRESTHVAIVIDEYGGTAGLVTLEDLIEEIVGEIRDEHDDVSKEGPELAPAPPEDGRLTWDADGSCRVDILQRIGLDVPEGPYETVAGLVADLLGRIPAVGDRAELPGWRLTVRQVGHYRAERVRLVRLVPAVNVMEAAR